MIAYSQQPSRNIISAGRDHGGNGFQQIVNRGIEFREFEILRVVVLVVDALVDHGVKGRDHPVARADARGDVGEREPAVLHFRKAGRRRLKVIQPAALRHAAPRLQQFDKIGRAHV